MINQTAAYFENLADDLGLSIKIPRPTPATRRACSVTNSFVGLSLIGTGALFKKPSLIVLGTLGLAGAVLLSQDQDD
ncbi:hypothetical protein JZO70_14595 [Enterococcus sp. 669A]|uniref:Uncharacterized protein n=1 Tax=Candidatus Enterococcus moelleringii TaxID=2815325 RepID=A0ABS3LCP4_9ENTE|nr:hypothetical protein [Enterococcus sp. 669A]MBO1307403.1 hypothetical protein [Enterococcus sp. 669A]